MGHFVGLHFLSTQNQFWVTMLEIVKVEMAPRKNNGAISIHVPVAKLTYSHDFWVSSASSL